MDTLDDRELEDRLRRYRPKGPPDHLRDTILARPKRFVLSRLGWAWAGIAAMILVVLVLNFQARRLARQTADLIATDPAASAAQTEEIVRLLGNDRPARTYIAWCLRADKIKRTTQPASFSSMGGF